MYMLSLALCRPKARVKPTEQVFFKFSLNYQENQAIIDARTVVLKSFSNQLLFGQKSKFLTVLV